MKPISRALLLGATLSSTIALSAHSQSVDEVIVLSTPSQKPANEVISTTEILSGDALQAALDKPIGDALSSLPGVDSAGYGPAVGQPLIRGLGGYRVDTMGDGMSLGDIAATGGDHANALSLFDTNRIEVLKGPAALRYGAFAATGVVNNLNRHMENGEDATDVLFGFGDNAGETMTAFFARRDGYALSGFAQDADAITIPTHAESARQLASEGETDEDTEQEAENTQNESRGFTVSGHFGDDETNLSLMLISHEMDYGVPGHAHEEEGDSDDDDDDEEHHEEAVSIDLEKQTVHARLTHNGAVGPFSSVRTDLSLSTLEQDEFEGDEIGLAYEQDTLHLRAEGAAALNGWQTLTGFEMRDIELTAEAAEHDEEEGGDDDGDDDEHGHGAYLPSTERSQFGLFFFAERERNGWLTELAARFDSIEQEAEHEEHHDEDDDDGDEEEEEHHGAVEHDITNLSVGLARKMGNGLLLGGSVSSTERAPSQVELFAEGRHAAARREEFGDDELDTESALAMELYLRKSWETARLRVAFFQNDYSDFIYLKKRSGTEDEFDYTQQDAELSGFEAEYQTGFTLAGRMVDATLSYASLSGELDNGGNLPAMPPQKIGVSLATNIGPAMVSLDIENADDQTDTATDELATDGYTSVDLSASWQPEAYEGLTITGAIRNLTDEEIRHHSSPVKDLLPEAGQDIRVTARYRF